MASCVLKELRAFNQNIRILEHLESYQACSSMFKDAVLFNQNIGVLGTPLSVTAYGRDVRKCNSAFNNGGSNTINNWNTFQVLEQMQEVCSTAATSFNQPVGSSWKMSNIECEPKQSPTKHVRYQRCILHLTKIFLGGVFHNLVVNLTAFRTNANATWRNDASKQPEWGVCNSNVSVITLSDTDAPITCYQRQIQ